MHNIVYYQSNSTCLMMPVLIMNLCTYPNVHAHVDRQIMYYSVYWELWNCEGYAFESDKAGMGLKGQYI